MIAQDLTTREGVLSQLLTGAMHAIDLPLELDAHARWRFGDVATYLKLHGDALGGAAWEIYPQGAFLIGTVTGPVIEDAEYDVDLVCLRRIDVESTTRLDLKAETGRALTGYVRVAARGPVGLEEGKRCWTLQEPPRSFHADVLPAIPDPTGSETGILITDREYSRWLKSDPKAFAAWFRERMRPEFEAVIRKMAEARGSSVEDIPPHTVKTTLQIAVQALKRHRDVYFLEQLEMAPPSVLLTTLAAHVYTGDRNLFETVVQMADRMSNHIERDGAGWCVPNPVQPAENFADRWRSEPERQRCFFGWIETLKRDLDEIARTQGIPLLSQRMAKSFGETAIQKSVENLGLGVKDLREAGKLAMSTGSGILTAITTPSSRPVRKHGFYGDAKGPTA